MLFVQDRLDKKCIQSSKSCEEWMDFNSKEDVFANGLPCSCKEVKSSAMSMESDLGCDATPS